MNPVRAAGESAIVGAALNALFWLMTLPLGTFVGAEVARSPLWIPSQALHVLGALFAVFGFFGIYAVARRGGTAGVIALFLVVSGTIFFLADGVIALAVFPALAVAAPGELAATGAMNRGIVLASFIAFAVVNMLGNLAFAAFVLRSRVFPAAAAVLLGAGGVLFNLPPGPVPLPVLAIGGVLWSVGLGWCGVFVRRAS